jgi:hypothetical protein
VAIPSTTNGSSPITCAPKCSRFWLERTCTPIIVLADALAIEEASVYLRRDARSLKKEFQSSLAASSRALGELELELQRTEVVLTMHDGTRDA